MFHLLCKSFQSRYNSQFHNIIYFHCNLYSYFLIIPYDPYVLRNSFADVWILFHDLWFLLDLEVISDLLLQYVQPRIRFFERAKEIEQCKPIEKQRNEYRTLIFMDEDKTLITGNIYPREVSYNSSSKWKTSNEICLILLLLMYATELGINNIFCFVF